MQLCIWCVCVHVICVCKKEEIGHAEQIEFDSKSWRSGTSIKHFSHIFRHTPNWLGHCACGTLTPLFALAFQAIDGTIFWVEFRQPIQYRFTTINRCTRSWTNLPSFSLMVLSILCDFSCFFFSKREMNRIVCKNVFWMNEKNKENWTGKFV